MKGNESFDSIRDNDIDIDLGHTYSSDDCVFDEKNSRSYLQLCFAFDDDSERTGADDAASKQRIIELSFIKALLQHSDINVFQSQERNPNKTRGGSDHCSHIGETTLPQQATAVGLPLTPISLLAVKCSEGYFPFCNSDHADLTCSETSCSEATCMEESETMPKSDPAIDDSTKSLKSSRKLNRKDKGSHRPLWSSTLASKEHKRRNPHGKSNFSACATIANPGAASVASCTDRHTTGSVSTAVSRKLKRSATTKKRTSVCEVRNQSNRITKSREHSSTSLNKHQLRMPHSYDESCSSKDHLDSSSKRQTNLSSMDKPNGLLGLARRLSRRNVQTSTNSTIVPAAERSQIDANPSPSEKAINISNKLCGPSSGNENKRPNSKREGCPERQLVKSASVRLKCVSDQHESSPKQLGNFILSTRKERKGQCTNWSCGV